MITTTMYARQIPDDTKVRKPTGQKYYVLQRSIKIYGNEPQYAMAPLPISIEPGSVLLFGEGSINVFSGSSMLSVDHDNIEEAIDFLQILLEA